MTKTLSNCTAYITGASRGIGRAIALELAQQGCDVALVARNADKLKELSLQCEQQGVKAIPLVAEITDKSAVQKSVKDCVAEFGKIDVLINNHGIAVMTAHVEDTEDQWEKTIDVNLKASMHLTRLILAEMLQQSAVPSKHRALIFIASVASKLATPELAAYVASKHGLLGFANSIFEEVREQGIKVSSICPGLVNTEMVASVEADPKKMIQPQDIAKLVSFILCADNTACPVEVVIRPQRSPYSS